VHEPHGCDDDERDERCDGRRDPIHQTANIEPVYGDGNGGGSDRRDSAAG
jgi:hypothetical protein